MGELYFIVSPHEGFEGLRHLFAESMRQDP